MMKESKNAKAIKLRMSKKGLNKQFNKLPDKLKWEWLLFSTENTPEKSLQFCRDLILRHSNNNLSE